MQRVKKISFDKINEKFETRCISQSESAKARQKRMDELERLRVVEI